MKKKIALTISIIVIVLFIIYADLLVYGMRQGVGQLNIIRKSVPVSSLIENPNTPDSIKIKLELISEVKSFAVSELGINISENYTTFFDQKGKPILWNVSASEKFELKAYEWSFPLLGKFSYKGYFNYELALKEEKGLKEKGLDTRVRSVGGWSTLGWFKDPVLSNMLNRNKGQLAELILHELIHGNLYVKDSVDFNENLATFFGRKGAELFLIKKFGLESSELNEYISSEEDFDRFIDHMLRGADHLTNLYSGFNESSTLQLKNEAKENTIRGIIETMDTLSFNEPARFENIFPSLPNNAYFMAIYRYRSKSDLFQKELTNNYNGDLKEYLQALISKYPSL